MQYGKNVPVERKADAAQDGASPEVKTAVDNLGKAFTEFKKANDERLKQLEAKGAADAVTEQKLKNIEAELEKAQKSLDDAHKKQAERIDQLEAAAKRSRVGGADGEDLDKKAADFSLQAGVEVNVDGLKAYNAALDHYLRKGEKMLGADEAKALSVGSNPDGGYLVTPDTSGRIVQLVYETSPMRQVANVVNIGTDALEGQYDNDEASAGWVGETQSRAETTTPQLGQWRIPVHELYAEPRITQKLLDDAMFNVEAWLQGKVADKFSRIENAAFINGDGVGKPRGFLNHDKQSTKQTKSAFSKLQYVVSGKSADFADTDPGDKLIDLMFSLKNAYRNGAVWMMNRKTLAEVRKLKDGDNNYLWQPNFEAKQGGLLLGYSVTEAEDMPDIEADSFSIAFGDFNAGYQIVDRIGIRTLRDPFTAKPYVKLYSTKRVGGDVINFEAIKLLKFGTS